MALPTQMWIAHSPTGPPRAERFEPAVNAGPVLPKPSRGGLWTSTWDGRDGSGWTAFMDADGWAPDGGQHGVWLLDVDPQARLICIDTLQDLRDLLDRYATPAPAGWPSALNDARGIDFEALAADGFHGVHLTDDGQWATRLTSPNLYGWDCESTLWLTWAFTRVRQLDPAAGQPS